MAIAGRSYPSVPVISRGSLEDPDDFIAKVTLVVTSQPSRAQTATVPATILRSTLADPPVPTTPAPLVVAWPVRWPPTFPLISSAPFIPPPLPFSPGTLTASVQPLGGPS